jgi:hypothetical protein
VCAGDKEPGEDGKSSRSNDGRYRDIAGDAEDHKKGCNGGERGPGADEEKDTETGGDAFAATKAEPDGEHVAKHGAESREGLGGAQGDGGHPERSEVAAEPNGCAALEDVEDEGGDAKAVSAAAHDVGGADVAAADGANILFAEDAHEEVTKGDGPQQVRYDRDGAKRKNHNERV